MASETEEVPVKKGVARSPTVIQRLKLEKLMKNPAKPAYIPAKPEAKLPRVFNPPEFVRDQVGSSAGAGSGDFHVYRGVRRREYARQKFEKIRDKEEIKDEEQMKNLAERQRVQEEKNERKRAKRMKKKNKQKAKKMKGGQEEKAKEDSEVSEEEMENGDCDEKEEKDDCEGKGEENKDEGKENEENVDESVELTLAEIKRQNQEDD